MSQSQEPKIIDGKILSGIIREEIKVGVDALRDKGCTPGLAVVLVGEDPASQVYVRNKRKTCEALGIASFAHDLPADTPESELLALIDGLNGDPQVHGILVQMPLPNHIDENKVLLAIDPDKDVDGFHPVNVGKLLIGEEAFVPCTPKGCQEMLIRSGNDPAGKHVVVVGRSNIVGKPMAALLMQKGPGANATVTVCHSRTQNLPEMVRQADIVIAAIGVPHFITADMVKEGVVVIDVGMNRIEDASKKTGYRLVGDVDYDAVKGKASAITPVPGGVGPMTITMLMKNTLEAASRTV